MGWDFDWKKIHLFECVNERVKCSALDGKDYKSLPR